MNNCNPYYSTLAGVFALVCAVGLFGCDDSLSSSSTNSETSWAAPKEAPQPPMAPATPPGRVSIADLREELGVGEHGRFVRSGGEITQIELYGTTVSDLSPLKGLPLNTLGISSCPVSDLSPLAGMPLERLSAQKTQVSDLAPLASTKLRELYLLGSPVSDITALVELPLAKLNLVDTKVTDISAVRGMPLHTLWIGGTDVSNLKALIGKDLVSLDIENTAISDLTPLADMSSLRRLNIADTNVTDLSPLNGLHLVRLIFNPDEIKSGMEAIRTMATLERIGLTFTTVMPAREFWVKYDTGQLGS